MTDEVIKLLKEEKKLKLKLVRLSTGSDHGEKIVKSVSTFEWSTRATSFKTGRSGNEEAKWDTDTVLGHDFAEKLGLLK